MARQKKTSQVVSSTTGAAFLGLALLASVSPAAWGQFCGATLNVACAVLSWGSLTVLQVVCAQACDPGPLEGLLRLAGCAWPLVVKLAGTV